MDITKLNALMTPKVREFVKSLYIDTRLKQTINKQVFREPKELKPALTLIKQNKEEFPLAVRNSGPNTYNIYIGIQKTQDDLERLALWADYLDLNQV